MNPWPPAELHERLGAARDDVSAPTFDDVRKQLAVLGPWFPGEIAQRWLDVDWAVPRDQFDRRDWNSRRGAAEEWVARTRAAPTSSSITGATAFPAVAPGGVAYPVFVVVSAAEHDRVEVRLAPEVTDAGGFAERVRDVVRSTDLWLCAAAGSWRGRRAIAVGYDVSVTIGWEMRGRHVSIDDDSWQLAVLVAVVSARTGHPVPMDLLVTGAVEFTDRGSSLGTPQLCSVGAIDAKAALPDRQGFFDTLVAPESDPPASSHVRVARDVDVALGECGLPATRGDLRHWLLHRPAAGLEFTTDRVAGAGLALAVPVLLLLSVCGAAYVTASASSAFYKRVAFVDIAWAPPSAGCPSLVEAVERLRAEVAARPPDRRPVVIGLDVRLFDVSEDIRQAGTRTAACSVLDRRAVLRELSGLCEDAGSAAPTLVLPWASRCLDTEEGPAAACASARRMPAFATFGSDSHEAWIEPSLLDWDPDPATFRRGWLGGIDRGCPVVAADVWHRRRETDASTVASWDDVLVDVAAPRAPVGWTPELHRVTTFPAALWHAWRAGSCRWCAHAFPRPGELTRAGYNAEEGVIDDELPVIGVAGGGATWGPVSASRRAAGRPARLLRPPFAERGLPLPERPGVVVLGSLYQGTDTHLDARAHAVPGSWINTLLLRRYFVRPAVGPASVVVFVLMMSTFRRAVPGGRGAARTAMIAGAAAVPLHLLAPWLMPWQLAMLVVLSFATSEVSHGWTSRLGGRMVSKPRTRNASESELGRST